MLSAARRIALDVEALLLPAACLGCGRALAGRAAGGPLCDPCRLALRPIAPPRCGRCGQTLDAWEMPGGREQTVPKGRRGGPPAQGCRPPAACGFCRSWPAVLAWAASACWFDDGPARALVHALKYGGWAVAAGPMAEAIGRAHAGRLGEADLLVPVPLGRRRLRERGHNQAALLAEAVGARCRVPVRDDVLVRARETRTQTALTPAERRANVAGAFRPTRRLAGARVVLVDDVLTTGATVAAAAAALAQAGAADVGAISFARAAKPG